MAKRKESRCLPEHVFTALTKHEQPLTAPTSSIVLELDSWNVDEASFAPLRRALSTLSHRLARDAGDFGRDVGFAVSRRVACGLCRAVSDAG
jgi:hypothetical protein